MQTQLSMIVCIFSCTEYLTKASLTDTVRIELRGKKCRENKTGISGSDLIVDSNRFSERNRTGGKVIPRQWNTQMSSHLHVQKLWPGSGLSAVSHCLSIII